MSDPQTDPHFPEHHEPYSPPRHTRRLWPGLAAVAAVVAIGGIILGANVNRDDEPLAPVPSQAATAGKPGENGQSASAQQTVSELQSAQQKNADQIAELQRQLAAEQGERKLLSDQLGALSARVDSLLSPNAEATGPAPKPRRRGGAH